jgi:hypothetical protein
MLNHQLPALLPVNAFWDALPEIFDWLHGKAVPVLTAMTMGAQMTRLSANASSVCRLARLASP